MMKEFIDNIISSIGITDVLDILIVTYVIYRILGFIKESRTQQLVKGVLVLVMVFFISDLFNLYTLHWILKGTFTLGVIALVVVFQPELRRGLEYMGRSKLVQTPFGTNNVRVDMHVAEEIQDAVTFFSRSKTGSLIVFERSTPLKDIMETGTYLDAAVSAQMLGNIFYEGAPLHDGAVVIKGGRIGAAGCVLPLTSNKNLNPDLGTRHRAGIGITENSDALVLIVSEETGIISKAEEGRLTRRLSREEVGSLLVDFYRPKEEADTSFIRHIKEKIYSSDNKDKHLNERGDDGNV
ncbi:diadenylate cyclase CdaA [Eubacteriales bacterium KG127]